ncbi:acyltransferase family protein [Cellulomonas composti]|uniref:Heparan-alpha-glucosaminide N-acetyltransferase catalytic domain-containing protein n=1 Tax=Cellulomonas composti TaxID=266130 RepID=A0A511JBY0_9CELL|nr:acyltransferase family protein [Cellulomonas composti]GEL95488.1 hypothetical protein CCO02nite_21460 [Cellulomonas composti]
MVRVVGVDVARGVAVLGMMTAHVGPEPTGGGLPARAAGAVLGLAHGRPSALFVVLAGLSLALLSGGPRLVTGPELIRARTRILVRAVLVLGLGVGLVALDTPVVVILPTYAVLFLGGCAVLTWPRRALVAGAVVVALVGPVVRASLAPRLSGDLADLFVGDFYPAVVWFAYLLAGLALGRSDLRSVRVRAVTAATGAALLVVGYGGAALASHVEVVHDLFGGRTSTQPHSSTTFEVTANTGTALLVVVACLLAAERFPRATNPLAAVGALALTAYTVHIVVIALVGPEVVYVPSPLAWLVLLAVTVLACWAWRRRLGRGPLERVLHTASTWVADRAVRAVRT